MPFLATPHGAVYYQVKGEGEPLLLLHGLSRSSRYWIGFDRRLAKHFQVITMDPRGLGRTKAPFPWGHSTHDMADDAALLLRHLGVKKAHIFGLSLGGMVALSFGQRHPRRARSLIVVNTSIGGAGYPRLTRQALLVLSLGVVCGPLVHPLLLKVCVAKSRYRALRQRIVQRWGKIQAEEGIPYATTFKQIVMAMRFRLRKDLGDLRVPTLVVYGSEDGFVSHGNSRVLSQVLPRAELCCIEGAGHEITIDQPQELAHRIVSFVRRLNGKELP